MTNLTRLDLYDNKISDVKPLAGLTKLTWLLLNETKSVMFNH
ncbi:leucine-rich repeat domain-containing protein [Kamptonema formosum]|nr:leucine-rich repeat domain-containing protein [Kamptonema formosum]